MAHSDFDGDGRDDVLWRNTNGTISNWLSTKSGGFTVNDANALIHVGADWRIVGSGDFDGDGRDDILWWNSQTYDLSNWLATENGGWLNNDAAAYTPDLDPTWFVLGTGDFNKDGRDDILWESDNGGRVIWLADADGGFDSANPMDAPDDWSWTNLVGDFNGDGRADILWYGAGNVQNRDVGVWLSTPQGTFEPASVTNPDGGLEWLPVGVGDFDDDGFDDILWRSTSGAVSNWLGTGDGGFLVNDANAFHQIPTSWHVVGVGDYDGDGNADVLWRHNSGALSNWLGTDTGGFLVNDANAMVIGVPMTWEVELGRQDPTWFF